MGIKKTPSLNEIAKEIVKKIADFPQKIKDEIYQNKKLILMTTFSAGTALASYGQLSDDWPKNKMNLIESEAETRDAASTISARVRKKDSLFTQALRGSVDTQNLTAHTTIIPNAPLPADLDTGTTSERVSKYRKYTKSAAPYDTGNGRPNTDPNDNLTYEYFSTVSAGDTRGTTSGSSTDYPGIVYFDLSENNFITPTQEQGHALGLSSNDGNTLHVKSDIFHSNTIPYIYDDTINTVISDGGGLMTAKATSSLDKRTDLVDHPTEGTILPLVFGTHTDLDPNFRNAYIPTENLADIEGTFDGTPPTLDQLYEHVKPGGNRDHRINTYDIDPADDIQFKTPELEKSGNIVFITAESIAKLESAEFNGFKPKLVLYIYPKNGATNNNNFPRNINGIDRPKVGFPISSQNPSVDLTNFLNHHGESIDDVSFMIGNLGQNGLSLPANTTTLAVDTNKIAGLSIYPNPVGEFLNISAESDFDDIKIYDVTGKLIIEANPHGERKITIPMGRLKTGLYIGHFKDKDGRVSTKFHERESVPLFEISFFPLLNLEFLTANFFSLSDFRYYLQRCFVWKVAIL
jgi:hypothetical protein